MLETWSLLWWAPTLLCLLMCRKIIKRCESMHRSLLVIEVERNISAAFNDFVSQASLYHLKKSRKEVSFLEFQVLF